MRLIHSSRSAILAVSVIGTVIFTLIIMLFPQANRDSVWKGYRVLAVPLEHNEAEVLALLDTAGIHELVTESNSIIQNDSEMAPAQPFLTEKNAQLTNWFIDAEQNVRFLYLKDRTLLEERTARALMSVTFPWYFEDADRSRSLPLVIAVFYVIALFIFSSQKLTFLPVSLAQLLFIFRCSVLSAYTSAILLIFGAYLLSELLEPSRSGLSSRYRLVRLKQNPLYLVPIILALLVSAIPRSGTIFLFLTTVALSMSLYAVMLSISHYIVGYRARKRLHPAFKPELMHPDSLIRVRSARKHLYLSITVPILFATGLVSFGNVFPSRDADTASGPSQVLYIPSPSGYTRDSGFDTDGYSELLEKREQGSLPDLAWFLSVRWNLATAPWRRAEDVIIEAKPGTVVTVVESTSDSFGKIISKEKTMGTFDTSFIRKAISGPITPLEKMLIEQDKFVMVTPVRHTR
jgi:hypothetical protein